MAAVPLMIKEGQQIPTVGTLEYKILMDQRLASWEKDRAMRQLQQDLGPIPKDTPLSAVLGRLGGGILGMLIARYFNMGIVGQAVAAAAGYGIGKTVSDFYNALDQLKPVSDNRQMVRPFWR